MNTFTNSGNNDPIKTDGNENVDILERIKSLNMIGTYYNYETTLSNVNKMIDKMKEPCELKIKHYDPQENTE